MNMKIISLGAGVQSSAMLLMGLEGRFGDKPDYAVFSDTGWEPLAVYQWLEFLKELVTPFPIITLSAGKSIRDDRGRKRVDGERFTTMPYFIKNQDGTQGIGRRQCTSEYKLKPLALFARSIGGTQKNPAEQWIGISTDEAHRMKPSKVQYTVSRWPLIEAGLSREDCQNYIQATTGRKAPKSSCIGCPFHGDDYWAAMRMESPIEFEDACKYDEEVRKSPGLRGELFLHRSLKPLRFITEFKHENQGRMFVDAFGNECEGVCGL